MLDTKGTNINMIEGITYFLELICDDTIPTQLPLLQ